MTYRYIDFHQSELSSSLTKLNQCVGCVQQCSLATKLHLNVKKTELIRFSSCFRAVEAMSLQPYQFLVEPKSEVRNLGVILDSTLQMKSNINAVCRSSCAALRKIEKIRKFLDKPTTLRLIYAFLNSRLDYCNSLISGLPKTQIAKLQRIQNSAARLVTLTKRRIHITPILYDLHWLPVDKRITYKTLLLTYKAMNNLAPEYITELLTPYTQTHSLRSAFKNLLKVLKSTTITYGSRAFTSAASTLWNALPDEIRNADSLQLFKTQLKTHLFTESFAEFL
ncbi:uncharacterized protein LOC117120193 [Anneissia japonica]|uniref:uncharacterized protein LOC117120193 n=1 Tax=Anneissia japonica TaxID=1529436 RepID=UPI0014258F29|nr:uncharacterized protein LOC117120193 [Anneissia japonica]